MKRRFTWLFICILLSLAPATFILLSSASVEASPKTSGGNGAALPFSQDLWNEKIDEALREEIDEDPDETFRFIVHLEERAELSFDARLDTMLAQRTAVIETLQQTAAASQAPLIEQLDKLQAKGQIQTYRSLWIINAIAATGSADAIATLATQPAVAQIRPDTLHDFFKPPVELETETAVQAAEARSWGIERIGAPLVWDGLQIDGRNVTVAIVDSGVDWLHPDLFGNYRGNQSSNGITHSGHWFYAPDPTATAEPFDFIGHGTHVAGTAVGQNGIGVAPGAKWIAVSIVNDQGLIYESYVHTAFQWLLAPGGDPALAPNVINNSWSAPTTFTGYVEDINVLHTAGIIPVFSSGNNGPISTTIGAPASYTNTVAAGASDEIDTLAWFSSRGPSPLTTQPKPLIVAPGTHILSALPDNQYGYNLGTSMAAPHTTGAIALLLSANPALSRQEIMQTLAETAVSIDPIHPNNDSGWGRLDAYAAVSRRATHGILQGTIRHNGIPLPGAAITITTPQGKALHYESDESGFYQAALYPGRYQITVTAFGFYSQTVSGLLVSNGQTTNRSFVLTPLPSGTIQGVVRAAGTGDPLPATVRVAGTPVAVQTDSNGRYTLTLPANQYELIAEASQHRLAHATVSLTAAQTKIQDFSLQKTLSILLVDSGQWYYDTFATYYRSALTSLDYPYEQWVIRHPFEDVPTAGDLDGYDVVIWSTPYDSPGTLSANNVITDYLGTGGNLLISGQNIGNRDGVSFGTQIWWYRDLEGVFLGNAAVSGPLSGAAGTHFSDVPVTLNGGDSANNQLAPDRVTTRVGSLSQPIFHYEDGTAAALQAGHCDPFRIVFLGFGLEGVAGEANRAAILESSFDYFQSPKVTNGLRWDAKAIDDFAVSGTPLTYTLAVRNLSETVTDTFHLSIEGATWTSTLLTPTLTLGPCTSGQTILSIDVPPDLPRDTRHEMQVTAVSSNNSSTSVQLAVQHKTPGQFLLVDDDRWYNQEAIFQSALDEMDLTYDVWEVGWDNQVRGSPPLKIINAYEMILWFTGYDWFAPVTASENKVLYDYLAQGGRLFLNSQDYLYYHFNTPLTQEFLGVRHYQEMITPTAGYAGDNDALSTHLAGPLSFNYGHYQNFSDGLIAGHGGFPFFWHNQGMAAAVANSGANWRTIFWGIPFETLPKEAQALAMDGIVGWLSDLGDSTFTVNRRTGAPGAPRSYTLTLRNFGSAPANQVTITNTLPAGLDIMPETISGGASYEENSRQLTWQGVLQKGEVHQIRYRAVSAPNLASGTRLDNEVHIHYQRHNLTFNRVATTWVNAPDLSHSTLTVASEASSSAQLITYTLQLHNGGLAAANAVTAAIRLPDALFPQPYTLITDKGTTTLKNRRVLWEGDLSPNQSAIVSLVLTQTLATRPQWLSATAVIQDGVTDTIVRDIQFILAPYATYYPFIVKQ